MKITACRLCGSALILIFSFGSIPAVNFYPSADDSADRDETYPLDLCLCEKCGLAQLDEVVNPKKLYRVYHYSSSASGPLRRHLEHAADLCRRSYGLGRGARALDIGCNDGAFLARLQRSGLRVLGVDPARNLYLQTKMMGIPVLPAFFSARLARRMAGRNGEFDLISAHNALAQMVDLHDFAAGVKILLAPRGVFNAEVSYVKDMLDKKTFDSIYHEHIAYFSLAPLRRLFGEHGLDVFDAQRIPNHGGSLRIFVRHAGDRTKPRTERMLRLAAQERGWGLGRREAFAPFVRFLERYRAHFRGEMEHIRAAGATIAGVGSPAKSVVLLNFCGLDRRTIDFIADSTPFKQGRLMPGTRIPIYPESELAERHPDYLLLLAWNYKKELLRKLQPLRKEGARVILPFPRVEIL